jgi:hypothetical protein
LCSTWMFTRDVCCKEVILMLKVVLLLHLWMKNEKFVTYDKLKCMNEE